MGKGLRSNVKKAVKRARRAILEEKCTLLKEREAKKYAVLKKILETPVVHTVPEKDTKRPSQRRRGRLGSDDSDSEVEQLKMEVDQRSAINVTTLNATRRRRKRAQYLKRNVRANQFVVTECEKQRIAKQRSKVDVDAKMESNLGLKPARPSQPVDGDRMEVTRITPSKNKTKPRKMPQGSEWMKIHKLVKGRRPCKRALRRRYRLELKGITQYYPIKKEETPVHDA